MARNEEGEFELMLGNKQLLSVFFLMVLLLVLCFVGGYTLGRGAAPALNAERAPERENKPLVVASVAPKAEPAPVIATPPAPEPAPVAAKAPVVPPPAKTTPAPPPPAAKAAPPTRTAPQVTTEPPVQAKATPSSSKAAPPAAKAPAAKSVPPPPPLAAKQTASSQPIPGRIYLQLSATDKDSADVMADLLRRKNLPGFVAPIADKPGLFRVLVGPLAATALPAMKTQLKANGFPGDEAIRRVF